MAETSSAAQSPPTRAQVVQVPAWRDLPWLGHAFSTRHGGLSTVYQPGDLNLGWTPDDDPAHVAENRRRLAQVAAPDLPPTIITVRQVHGAVTLEVPGPAAAFVSSDGRALQQADGLLTAAPGLLLGIQTADCVPVLVVDIRQRVVAAFHAGWRGTAQRIVEQGIAQLQRDHQSRPEDLRAAIGPSIGACCYTVGTEVHQQFTAAFPYAETLLKRATVGLYSPDLWTADLWEANRRQLLAAGLAPAAITVVGECTACTGLPGPRRYFSHRAEHGVTGRMMAVIGIAPV